MYETIVTSLNIHVKPVSISTNNGQVHTLTRSPILYTKPFPLSIFLTVINP